jgi:hypothetical protein
MGVVVGVLISISAPATAHSPGWGKFVGHRMGHVVICSNISSGSTMEVEPYANDTAVIAHCVDPRWTRHQP